MSKSGRALVTLAILAAAAWSFAPELKAQPKTQPKESPLLSLAGNWTGQGAINFSDGSKERIRCRSHYVPDASGANLRLELRCASDSYKFELQSNIAYSNGEVTGDWTETTRSAAGNITGTASGNRIEVRAVGQTFAAFLNINTRGSSQSVSIKSPGSTMSEVAITLAKQ
jgi:hypothetical protein